MLKRLELVGFKSFADKTVFDFAAGITAIVGPNGAGKSNIVDAVKWILGEQSAKSLRGGEMADVIFNGSTSRRSLGMAEVTMTFDNSKRNLAVDGDEVQITRRVYRDGQGEYLINQQPTRLRDIKDLFLGSGAGHGAYAIIEQGRVDVLLQASHKDRRQIFEEAAGISRFKARKIETLRKLEHVESNLQRSNDLLAELDKQLRSVKLQAAKAQRYQEHSARLKELRVRLGLREFGALTVQWQAETDEWVHLSAELRQAGADAAAGEGELLRLDGELSDLEQCLRKHESTVAEARRRIAADDAERAFESNTVAEWEQGLAAARQKRDELTQRCRESAGQVTAARADLAAVVSQAEHGRAKLTGLEGRVREVNAELSQLSQQLESDREEHLERLRLATRFQNDSISLATRLENLRSRRDGLSARSSQNSDRLASIDSELQSLRQEEAGLVKELQQAREDHGRHVEVRENLRRQAENSGARLADLRVRRSGLASRIELLEQLEKRQEGLGAGVREVLAAVREARQNGAEGERPGEDWSFIVGLVADCLVVPREHAALIDLALGDLSQCFVVRDAGRLDETLRRRDRPFIGRVGFLPLRTVREAPAFPAEAGPAERADLCVTAAHADVGHLPAQLLGPIRIVPDLATARSEAAKPENAGLRYVTRAGELLEPGGRLTVGTHHSETNLLSRKSELRDLRQQALDQDCRIADSEVEHVDLRDQTEALERPIFELQQRINELIEDVGEIGARVKLHQQKHCGLKDEVDLSREEISGLVREIVELDAALAKATLKAQEAERDAAEIQRRAEQAERSIRERDRDRLQREQECTRARVELAQTEERLAGLRERLGRLEEQWHERQGELERFEQDQTRLRDRIRDGQLKILRASSALANCFMEKETAEQEIVVRSEQRGRLFAERKRLAQSLQQAGTERQEKSERAHAHELRASQLQSRRAAIADRLHEDYQVELAELWQEHNAELPEAPGVQAAPDDSVQAEIEELRRKLDRLGAVNLAALQELSDLEHRVTDKQAQHEDLTRSQRDLLEIILKIDQDSKTLFTESFASIRAHFQDLFRRLFGGGMADIILEDENDVLECGIEITARPPGKELRTISLMSGGERTLTAIALLLAIFRSKPSPFCLLDEVDAALDEANNTRLAGVLNEFVEQSQFIVVTHKKRTMAVAHILYGISMQEAGVSRPISVRFEDWPEDAVEETRAAG
jgi:chromosome segregation protein